MLYEKSNSCRSNSLFSLCIQHISDLKSVRKRSHAFAFVVSVSQYLRQCDDHKTVITVLRKFVGQSAVMNCTNVRVRMTQVDD